MKKEDKVRIIDDITDVLKNNDNIYLTDISGLDSKNTYELRKLCHENKIFLRVIKNTFLKIAMVNSKKKFDNFFDSLSGNSCLMISDVFSGPAKIILQMRKSNKTPILKSALVQDVFYSSDSDVPALSKLKSKEELIAGVVSLLKSPIINLIGSLESSKNNIFSILKSLSEKK